jgi:hypothetical protein
MRQPLVRTLTVKPRLRTKRKNEKAKKRKSEKDKIPQKTLGPKLPFVAMVDSLEGVARLQMRAAYCGKVHP